MKTINIVLTALSLLVMGSLFAQTQALRPANYDADDAGTADNPYLISNLANLRWLSEVPEDWAVDEGMLVHFLQTADIDATETINWNDGEGFLPIGVPVSLWDENSGIRNAVSNLWRQRMGRSTGRDIGLPLQSQSHHLAPPFAKGGKTRDDLTVPEFTGVYDGGNYSISNLYIYHNDPDNEIFSVAGMFGMVLGSEIKNVRLVDVDVYSLSHDVHTGGLAGIFEDDTIVTNCYVSGSVVSVAIGNYVEGSEDHWAYSSAGGIAGGIYDSIVSNCISDVDVSGTSIFDSDTGGIAGSVYDVLFEDCGAMGNISGTAFDTYSGGIFGYGWDSIISRCYANGNISGVGINSDEDIAATFVGGLSGNGDDTTFENCYFVGNVHSDSEGDSYAGGLVGNVWQMTMSKCYAAAIVEATGGDEDITAIGAIAGYIAFSSIYDCLWDSEIAGEIPAGNYDDDFSVITAEGKTTAQMKQVSYYTALGWDFESIWDINPDVNDGYPYLINDEPPTSEDDWTIVESPRNVWLGANYPNPFNPETTITFSVAAISNRHNTSVAAISNRHNTNVTISIYNIKGQKVKTLVNDQFGTGTHKVVWNGTDDTGNSVASGVYFYKLKSNGIAETRRMLLMK